MDGTIRDQIISRINAYDGNVVSLGHLIADLDAVWNTESWDNVARRQFRREWGSLEQLYSTAVEQRSTFLGELDRERVEQVLGQLKTTLPPATERSEGE